MRFPFHFRPIPCIAALLLAVLGIALGNWQQGRAAEKLAVQEKLAARASQPPVPLRVAIAGATAPLAETLEYRRVRVTGEFVADWPLFLANRPMAGRPGYYLVMPFKIADSRTSVLVMRGWLPREAEFGKLPAFATPAGTITIEGMVVASAGHVMELGKPAPLAPGAIVQNIDPAQAAAATGLLLQSFFVQQTGPDQPDAVDDMLLRVWPSPSSGIDKHRGYAFQWYALAAMAILFFVITGFRSGSRQADARKPDPANHAAGSGDAGRH
ncbi:SURF1 family protein [Massilia sp. X63]|uniref:SURF1 family protein n=1 Tax=Massilia sp. X63 TaxID=3237285 RepID=UPI0034DD3072